MELAYELSTAKKHVTTQDVTVRIYGEIPRDIKSKFFDKLQQYGLNPTKESVLKPKKSYIEPPLLRIKSLITATNYLFDAFSHVLNPESLSRHKQVLDNLHKKFNNTVTLLNELHYSAETYNKKRHLDSIHLQIKRCVEEIIEYVKPIMVEHFDICVAEVNWQKDIIEKLDRAEQYYLLTQARPPLVTISCLQDAKTPNIYSMQIERCLENFDTDTLKELEAIRKNGALPDWFKVLPKMQQALLRHTLKIMPDPKKWSQVSRLREIPGLANFAENRTVFCDSLSGAFYERKALRSAHPASRDVRRYGFAQTFVERSYQVAEHYDNTKEMMLLTLISPLRRETMLQGVTPDTSLHNLASRSLEKRTPPKNGGICYAANLSLNYGQYLAPGTDAVSTLRHHILRGVSAKFPYVPQEESEEAFVRFVKLAYEFAGRAGQYFPSIKKAAHALLKEYEPSKITDPMLAKACREIDPQSKVLDVNTRQKWLKLLKEYIALFPLSPAQEKILSENLLVASLAKACSGEGGQELPARKVAVNAVTTLQGDPDAHNLHLAARLLMLAESVGVTNALTCVSGKDRTALVLIVRLAMDVFFQKMGYSYDYDDGSSQEKDAQDTDIMARIVAQLYANQHHSEFASQNAPGAFGIKHVHKYLPNYYVAAIEKLGLSAGFEDALASMNDLDKLLLPQESGIDLSSLTLLDEAHCRSINDTLTALLGEGALWSTKGRDITWFAKVPEGVTMLRQLFCLDKNSSSKMPLASPLHVLARAIEIVNERKNVSRPSNVIRDDTTNKLYDVILSIVHDFPKLTGLTPDTRKEHVKTILDKLEKLKPDIFKATENEECLVTPK